MTKEELKKLLKEIEKEKKEKEKEKEQAEALLEKLAEKIADKVTSATKEGKAKRPKNADPSKKDLSGEEKVKKFFEAVVRGEKEVAKALAEGVDASGGYLVPEEFSAQIVDWAQDKPVIRRYATVWPMKSNTLKIPALAADVSVYCGTENTSISTTSADFTEIQLSVNKLNAIIYLSTELFEDASIDLVSYLTDRFAQAIYREEDRKFITGTGSGQPTGLSQYSIASIDANNAGSVDDIIETYWRLPQSHRDNAVWIMSNLTIAEVSKKKDNNGQYLLVRPTDGGLPTLMGRPVLEQNDCGNTIYFGDLRFYYIGDRRKLSVKTTTEGAGTFEKDQVAIKVTERVDGKLALTRAFRKIINW